MTSTINDTVQGALSQAGLGSYGSQARPVVDALVAREQEMADALIGYATQQGMREEDAAAACRQVGMHLPTPAPVATIASAAQQNQQAEAPTGEAPDLATTLARINDTLEDLAGFARQNGWRPSR
jgi:hypothetical protein